MNDRLDPGLRRDDDQTVIPVEPVPACRKPGTGIQSRSRDTRAMLSASRASLAKQRARMCCGIVMYAGELINGPVMTEQPCVYILTSRRNGTLYVGVTSDLVKRAWEHRNGVVDGFTQRYGVHYLVWFEQHDTMESAIAREKAIKEWKRAWKLRLIEQRNPEWRDLYDELL